jgi:hypothetical protein
MTNRITNTAEARFRPLSSDVTRPRERTQETAQRLSLIAIRNWEKALTGVIALPAAAALTTASVVLFGVSILEQTFALFESTLADVGRRVGEDFDAHGDPHWSKEHSSHAS